ncbi:MAG: metal-binding protein [Snowella sp.]
MPSGQTHDRITLWTVPLVSGIAYFLTQNGKLALILAGGFLFSGLMFGPDLDIYSVQYKRWGWFRWIWIPYRSAIRHRSQLSHGLLIGTILRLLYISLIILILSGIIAAIAYLFGYVNLKSVIDSQKQFPIWNAKYTQALFALIIGLELGAMSHSISDWIGSAYKRNKTQKTRSRSAAVRSQPSKKSHKRSKSKKK